MRWDGWRLGMAATIAASMAAVPAAFAHEGHGGGSSSGSSGSSSAAAPEPAGVNYEILQGAFFPMPGHEEIFGSAKLGLTQTESKLWAHLSGLEPGGVYAVHLHEGSCSAPGGHYQNTAGGPAGPPNELWATSDDRDPKAGVTADADGRALGEGVSDWRARHAARAVMLHDPSGDMVACADLI